MFTTVQGFLKTWKYESESTSKMMKTLTDASLAQAVTPVDRTLGRLAWHVTTTIAEMMERTGLRLGGPASRRARAPHRAGDRVRLRGGGPVGGGRR